MIGRSFNAANNKPASYGRITGRRSRYVRLTTQDSLNRSVRQLLSKKINEEIYC